MLTEPFLDLRISKASSCFSGTRGTSCGPGGTGSSGFGSSATAGAAGAWSRARCVSSCTFYAVDVGFFGNCLLAAPELIKALPSPSCLARGGFGDAGADWRGEWPPTMKPNKPSSYTPRRFAVGHTHKTNKGFKAFLHSGWLQRKAHPRWETRLSKSLPAT